jgi:hypothetical protein
MTEETGVGIYRVSAEELEVNERKIVWDSGFVTGLIIGFIVGMFMGAALIGWRP